MTFYKLLLDRLSYVANALLPFITLVLIVSGTMSVLEAREQAEDAVSRVEAAERRAEAEEARLTKLLKKQAELEALRDRLEQELSQGPQEP